MGDQQGGHLWFVHAKAHAVASHPGLRHFEERVADAVLVADAHFVVGQAVHGEVLAELAMSEVVAVQVPLPVPVGVHLVHQHCPVRTAVTGKVALAVAVDVQFPDHPRARDRLLPHARMRHPALPGNIPGHPDIHGDERGHRCISLVERTAPTGATLIRRLSMVSQDTCRTAMR